MRAAPEAAAAALPVEGGLESKSPHAPGTRSGALDGLRALAGDMLATMYEAPGIGLAATQLGVMKRIFVMDCADKDAPPQPMVLLNPEIVWRTEETETSEEGCLSVPDVYEQVTRPARVRLRCTRSARD